MASSPVHEKSRKNPAIAVVASATAILIAFYAGAWCLPGLGLRLNVSDSEAVGFYWMESYKGQPLEPGDLIEFCPPIRHEDYPFVSRGDCAGGTRPFLKSIAAIPGDTVLQTDAGVRVKRFGDPNGARILHGSRPKAGAGKLKKPLPQWRGQALLKAGEYWVYGSQNPENSFDSRYFGPVKAGQIISIKKPHERNTV